MTIIAKPPDRAHGGNMPTTYEQDIIRWSEEQAHFLLSGQLDKLDLIHLADEVLDVGKSEVRELQSRMSILLMHLIKWAWQPTHRGNSWKRTIRDQRAAIHKLIAKIPSLKHKMGAEEFWSIAWADAVYAAGRETGISSDIFPEELPWTEEEILAEGWLPETAGNM